MKPLSVTLSCLPLLGLWACGTDDAKPIPLDQLQARTVAVACKSQVLCKLVPDQATCAQTVSIDMQLISDVNAGKVKYDGAAAAECLAFLDSPEALGSCSTVKRYNLKLPAACDDAFVGTLADGADCLTAESCVSDQCDRSDCASSAACCPGKCVAKPSAVAVGGDCSRGQACVDGAFCRDQDTGIATCQPPATLGAACQGLTDCVDGTICQRTVGSPGTCELPVYEGQPCVDVQHACDDVTDFCNPASSTCTQKAGVGGACTSDEGCVGYAKCDAKSGTCLSLGNIGDACVLAFGDCIPGFDCVGGKCTAPQPGSICQ